MTGLPLFKKRKRPQRDDFRIARQIEGFPHMTPRSSAPVKTRVAPAVDMPLQPASQDIWEMKYRLATKDNVPVDKDVHDTYARVARALADCEAPEKREEWFKKFLWAMENGAIPAGRVTSNAGAKDYKPSTSTINCTVSDTIHDSMDDILQKVHEAGLTLKAGCGIGYEFSTLRPRGAFVAGAGAYTSGPLSFMDIYDKMCFTVSSAGGRRGAQMGTFDIGHPDVLEFVKAKRENGRLRQFNLSLLISDDFMKAVSANKPWPLVFPLTKAEAELEKIDIDDSSKVVWRRCRHLAKDKYVRRNTLTACRVYKTIPSRRLWDLIMTSTYDYAEPGFILIDRVNEMNNNWFCEEIRATNPCGEQPLPPYGACLLGSLNLTKFVLNPFTPHAEFDWPRFKEVVKAFTRMLDNVVEINGLPLEKQRQEIIRKRRHGLGFLGLGSTMAMLRIKYGERDSLEFTEEVSKAMAVAGWEAGIELAKEKGAAPIMDEEFEVTAEMLALRPEMARDGLLEGERVKGKVLLARYSRYMQALAKVAPKLIKEIEKHGARFTHHSSIAPTGTISLSLGNNASNGIEPSFAHQYARNVIRPGKKSKEKVEVFSFEMLLYRNLIDADAKPDTLPEYFVCADAIPPKAHVDVQAAAQKWIDSSISKTINVPTGIPYDEFKDIYLYAAEKGLKGCTTFRFNPEAFQGVLVKEEDLEKTQYEFVLEDGSTVVLKGNEKIEYDGEIHTAANLFDALKEGYYGKF